MPRGQVAPERRAVELAKCAADVAYFCDTFATIDDSQGNEGVSGQAPFRLWPAQVGVLWKFLLHRLIIILKARQLGISWLCCVYALWMCLFQPGKVVLLLSKGQVEANELLRRVTVLYERLPDWMKDGLPARTKNNTQVQEWANGSRVVSLPASPEAGRSFTASLVILDEAAIVQYADRILTALKPTIDGGGQLILLSTANGIGNLFFQIWKRAARGIGSYTPIFLPWWSRPARDAAWYAKQVEDEVDKKKVRQEYPGTAEEAFLASGSPYFDLERLQVIAEALLSPEFAPIPPEDLSIPRVYSLIARESGKGLTVWEAPKPNGRYLITADTAEGLDGEGDHDSDCADVWDADTWTQVAQLHGAWDTDEYGRMLADLGFFYNTGLLAIERNNHGHAVINAALHRAGYPEAGKGRLASQWGGLYLHEEWDEYTRVKDRRIGWPTDKSTKFFALDELAAAIAAKSIHLRSPLTVGELMTFVKKPGGKAGGEGRAHDDAVTSASIGAALLRMRPPKARTGFTFTR